MLKDVFAALTERTQAANPQASVLARYGKIMVKSGDSDGITGFACMIIRVSEEDVPTLPRAYGGNSQEWYAVKLVFKSYTGVVAHPMLAAWFMKRH